MGSANSIGRVFLELGAKIDPLVKDIDGAVRVMSEADAKLASSGKKIAASFENALNPARRLEKQLIALGQQGKSSADIVKVYGDRIQSATDAAMRHGQALSPMMANYRQLSQVVGQTAQQMAVFSSSANAAAVSGNKLKVIGGALESALKPLRMAAYLLPGLGIAGIITLTSEWLTKLLPIPDAIKDIFQSEKELADQTKKTTDEIERQTDIFDKYADAIEGAKRRIGLMGLAGIPRSQADVGLARMDEARSRAAAEALQGQFNRLYVAGQQTRIVGGERVPTEAALEALKKIGDVQDQLRKAENEYALAKLKTLESEKGLTQEIGKEQEKKNKLAEDALNLQLKMGTETEQWAKVVEAAAKIWKYDIAGSIAASREELEKLAQSLDRLGPRGWVPAGPSVGVSAKDLEPGELASMAASKGKAATGGLQISTIFTDWSRALARAALDARNFGSILLQAAKSTGEMLIRALLEQVLAPIFNRIMGGFSGGTSTAGGWGGIIGSIGGIFSGSKGATVPAMGTAGAFPGTVGTMGTVAAGTVIPKGMSLGASLGATAALTGGLMLGQYGYSQGSPGLGALGGGIAGAGGGFLLGSQIGAIGGPWGMAIGAAIGAAIGGIASMFGGGAVARQREAERRAGVQSSYMTDIVSSQTYSGGFGYGGNVDVETDLRGQAVARRAVVVNVNVNGSIYTADDLQAVMNKSISRALLTGGSQVADNVGWATGRM